jgi:hypothetical protein
MAVIISCSGCGKDLVVLQPEKPEIYDAERRSFHKDTLKYACGS